ncbi:metal ABC transporter solute-binding protein, Zn/Mn family [Sporosarcina sp. Te-1]|uniref:metal ABC transporter solute-binding protein, Zn/Mn family n=1 Tax=Sporosarcina sp. Te-1 TaxID=2818390 RepID=UPI001A9D7A8F|nr:zinc ABC transporter substrate-binding protein [Sporosarcina sp. Te-1]QTD40050.1 zinc ABC transporter substrate-binding protein [Sporosarcina sp. Te-1]
MKKKKYGALLTVLLSGLVMLGACAENKAEVIDTEGKIHIVTTIAQIAEPLSIIGGDHVAVESLMGPGVDPHLYKATQGDIKKLEGSDIVLYSGLNLEGNMIEAFEKIGKKKPVLAISEAIPKEKLLHDENGAIDPHVWFDLALWKLSLESATEELKTYAPEYADDFEANKEKYFTELDELLDQSKGKLSEISKEKRVLVTAHDAFGYFGRAYDMEVVGLQGLSTEDEIGISDIDDTIGILLEYKIPAVFVESSINQNSIKAVIEGAEKKGLDVKLGGELYSDAMGDAGTVEGTYIGMYQHNVNTIHKALLGEGN